MKKLMLSAIIGTSMAVILTACVSPKTRQLEQHNQTLYDSVKAEVNPNPTQKYDIIIDASNTLDGLALSNLSVKFTSKCQLFLRRIPVTVDIHQPLTHTIPVQFKQIGTQKYQATVYQDWLIDKDYFNQGKNCGWQTPSVYYELRPTFDTAPYKFVIKDYYELSENQKPDSLLGFNPEYILYRNQLSVKLDEKENTIWLSSSKKTFNDLKPNSGLVRVILTKK